MAGILMATKAMVAATTTAGRSEATRADQLPDTETEAGKPVSFAVLLKSCNRKAAADCDGKMPPTADPLSAAIPTLDPAALLSRLESESTAMPTAVPTTEPSLAPGPDPSAVPGMGALPIPAPPLSLALARPSINAIGTADPTESLSAAESTTRIPVGVGATAPTPTIMPPQAPVLASPPMPNVAPRPGKIETRDAEVERKPQQNGAFADPVSEPATATDKLAVKAAITAETGKTGMPAATSGEPGIDFRAAMERLGNPHAPAAMQAIASGNTPPQAPALRVETPLGQPGWNREVGETLTWMASNHKQQAELVLTPPQLGRIEVSMTIEGDQLNATFASANAAVREALENSLPRLREVLAEAGITLGDTHVGAETRREEKPSNARNAHNTATNTGRDSASSPLAGMGAGSEWRVGGGRGMVDVFA